MNNLVQCPLCKRACPPGLMENHHLKTRRKSAETLQICRECHKAIHGLFSNQMLRDEQLNLDTAEGLMSNKRFYKAVVFIRKLEPGQPMQMDEAKAKEYYFQRRPF